VKLKGIISRARNENRTILTEIESKQIFADAGINCTDTRLARTKEDAVSLSEDIGYPVVLKISSVEITHKSDAGGVKVNLSDSCAVEKAFDDIIASVKKAYPGTDLEGISVQAMAKPGTEIIIGMTKDPQFGPVIMFGLGGIMVEMLKDVAFRTIPLNRDDAVSMIKGIKGYKLLQGYRGQEPADINSLADMVVRLSDLIDKTPEIKEVDMNPVFVYGDGAVVADARIVLE
jgi:acyl-CoA synthetase (NDP forming)